MHDRIDKLVVRSDSVAWPAPLSTEDAAQLLGRAANNPEVCTPEDLTVSEDHSVTVLMHRVMQTVSGERTEWSGASVPGQPISKDQMQSPPVPPATEYIDHILEFHVESSVQIRDCMNCQGSRRSRCGECDGKSRVPCVRHVRCVPCDGEKTVGGKPCATCSGTGSMNCERCKGSGRRPCGNCEGTGRIPCVKCDSEGAFTSAIVVRVSRRVDQRSKTLGTAIAEVDDLEPRVWEVDPAVAANQLATDGLDEVAHEIRKLDLPPEDNEILRRLLVSIVPVFRISSSNKSVDGAVIRGWGSQPEVTLPTRPTSGGTGLFGRIKSALGM